MNRRPPTTTLFPYTTLFRSVEDVEHQRRVHGNSRMQTAGGLPGAIADGRDEFAGGAGGMQRDAAAVAGHKMPRRRHPCHLDRKSTRLNSSHRCISYAVFCLK